MTYLTEKYVSNEMLQVNWPHGKVRVEDLKITHQVGEHARLRLVGRVYEEIEEGIITKSGPNDFIEVYELDVERGTKTLFMGQIQQLSVRVMHEQNQLVVEAISHTFNMDTYKRKRSFQHVDQKYSEIMDDVVAAYPESDFIDYSFNDKKTGKFIMQYEETDWCFLQRLASHEGAPLVADITAHKPRFWIGIPEGRRQIKLPENYPFEVSRRIQAYLYTASSNHIQKTQDRTTTYTFEWMSALDIGDEVIKDDHTYVIARRQAEMKQGQLIWTYECGFREGYKRSKVHNNAIIGAAINGKIIGVSRQQVKIHLDMDCDQNDGLARWFPYAAEGNQVWYMMPEKGSKVKLYFPSAEEDEAFVIQSVRQEPGMNYAAKQQQKMADPRVKTFGNPQGKEFTLGDKELNITGREGQLYIGMNSFTGVNLSGNQQVRILAAGGIHLSGNQVELTASESLSLERIADTLETDEEAGSAGGKQVTGKLGLGDDISSYSEKIKFTATGEREEYEPILSDFEKQVQEHGAAVVKERKYQESKNARKEAVVEVWKETGKELWGFVVDVLDMGVTTIHQVTSPLRLQSWDQAAEEVRERHSFFLGREVKPLNERNETLQGVTSTIQYVIDTATLKKSWSELWGDTKNKYAQIKEGVVDPVVMGVSKRSMSYYTTTEEENKALGNAWGQTSVLGAEAIITAVTSGSAAAAKAKHFKSSNSKKSKTSTVDNERKKGVMGFIAPSGAKGLFGKGVGIHDGRFKTRGSALDRVMENFGEAANKMKRAAIDQAPYYVIIRQTTNGIKALDVVKNDKSKLFSMGGDGPDRNKGKTEGTPKAPTKVNYGDQYTKDGRKKVLKPDVEYTSKEGYNYRTDSHGRVSHVEGELKLGDGKRNGYAQRVAGREDRLPDDEGGHLIASIFKGSGDLDNLVPMNGNLNKGEWKKLENTWADALKQGDEVKVKITPNYKGNSQRPDSFDIKYKIGEDDWEIRRFDNVPGGKLDE
ncbi:DNA/RNA non-specific endonuclease [Paenibacillus lentus]|uniref:DNA/RNA non-specific endonuclease n=1 Tax=Paenibacillus lentus TaxID=1338368 RepID=UPI0013DE6A8B|nr:DNA/RNA non-specific endonuclease [Paenibacillus lentus]